MEKNGLYYSLVLCCKMVRTTLVISGDNGSASIEDANPIVLVRHLRQVTMTRCIPEGVSCIFLASMGESSARLWVEA